MAIFSLSKLVSTTFPTVLDFFLHLFIRNYSVAKNYIIGHKINKKFNRGVKIGCDAKYICFLQCTNFGPKSTF